MRRTWHAHTYTKRKIVYVIQMQISILFTAFHSKQWLLHSPNSYNEIGTDDDSLLCVCACACAMSGVAHHSIISAFIDTNTHTCSQFFFEGEHFLPLLYFYTHSLWSLSLTLNTLTLFQVMCYAFIRKCLFFSCCCCCIIIMCIENCVYVNCMHSAFWIEAPFDKEHLQFAMQSYNL